MKGGQRLELPVNIIFLSYSQACYEDKECAPRYVDYELENVIVHQEFSFKRVREHPACLDLDLPTCCYSWGSPSSTWPS